RQRQKPQVALRQHAACPHHFVAAHAIRAAEASAETAAAKSAAKSPAMPAGTPLLAARFTIAVTPMVAMTVIAMSMLAMSVMSMHVLWVLPLLRYIFR
ncbi:MAG: hypothetical protein WBE90_07875, partial [Xanthobacteraceae bacterium]